MTTARYPGGSLSEVTCQRSVNGASFASGNQNFVFSVGAPSIFVPRESYFIIDATLTYEGRQPTLNDEIAFALDAGACIYDNAYVKVGSQDISSVTNFLPQASIVKHRLSDPKHIRDSVGASVSMLNPYFRDRRQQIAVDGGTEYSELSIFPKNPLTNGSTIAIDTAGVVTGVGTDFNSSEPNFIIVKGMRFTVINITDNTELSVAVTPDLLLGAVGATTEYTLYRNEELAGLGANRQFIKWQPPCGFFDHNEPMGAGDYMITLNPNSEFKKAMVQSSSNLSVGTGAGQFDVVINDVKLYIATYQYILPNTPTQFALKELLVQSKSLSGGSEQFTFTVPPSTTGLSFFIQANSAGSNTFYPPTKLITNSEEQNGLESYQITYANKTVPQTRWTGGIGTIGALPGQIKRLTVQQRYNDTFTESGLIVAGPETIVDWIDNGQLVYHNFVRDSKYPATQVQFSITGSQTYTVPTKLYLVAHYRTGTAIESSDGMITSVRQLAIV